LGLEARQADLSSRIADGQLRYVFLDPDGTSPPWAAVIIESQTGVVYANQCGGIRCDERLAEGYLVPLSGLKVNVDDGPIDPSELTTVFHQGRACCYNWATSRVPDDRVERLRELVAAIPFWSCRHRAGDEDSRTALRLDDARLEEICEAWVPVVTTEGPGVLVYQNCD